MSKFKAHLLRPDYKDGSTGLEEATLFEPEYMVRETELNTYEVTKWTHGKAPTGIYTVRLFKKESCDCPARGKCRHIQIVKDWIKAGKKSAIPLTKIDVGKIKYHKRFGEK